MADVTKEISSIASYFNVSSGQISITEKEKVLCMKTEDETVKGFATVARHLARKGSNQECLGTCPLEQALVSQWLEYRVMQLDRCSRDDDLHRVLKELNGYLMDRTYFAGHHLTLADIVLYYGLHRIFSKLTFQEKEKYIHLSRWFNQIQYENNVRQKFSTVYFMKTAIYQ
ncbi:Eukaryotic translation elongation factor 1 epsilon-1 [Lamellibrachia satsuma]|nr:Eukaryotic translation elongation factor 1 epsilon-1 [Lamellibrachia satsuma]